MAKRIPFNYFAEGQELYLNIQRLTQVEALSKQPIGDVVNTSLNLTNLAIFLSVGLQQYGRKDPQYYLNALQELVDSGKAEISDVQQDVVKAIVGSGVLGRAAYLALFPEEATADGERKAEEERKN